MYRLHLRIDRNATTGATNEDSMLTALHQRIVDSALTCVPAFALRVDEKNGSLGSVGDPEMWK